MNDDEDIEGGGVSFRIDHEQKVCVVCHRPAHTRYTVPAHMSVRYCDAHAPRPDPELARLAEAYYRVVAAVLRIEQQRVHEAMIFVKAARVADQEHILCARAGALIDYLVVHGIVPAREAAPE